MLRTNTRKSSMPHDGAIPAPILNGRAKVADTPRRAKLALSDFDFSKPLVWTKEDWATQFNALVTNPPLHSVVVEIEPAVAEQLLKLSNTKNRPKQRHHVGALGQMVGADSYELTGDTVKFSKKGTLLDGQHRLDACRLAKQPILTHIVFGLEDDIFDVLDQGKKRTPGDILALCGIGEATMVAGAIAWVLKFQIGLNFDSGTNVGGKNTVTPRKIRELALGSMKDISKYTKDARLINVAYKHPPTMIAGFLYLIGKRDPALARDFAQEWVNGAKIGRNKNFDVLNQRLMSIAHTNNGVVSRSMRAALLVQTFNYWNAHVVASPRALTWRKGWTFPELEFNADRFKAGKAVQDRENTSLPAVTWRVHFALTQLQDKHCESRISSDELAKLANVSPGSVSYIIGELIRGKQISKVSEGKKGTPSVYRINIAAAEIAKVAT